jgi:formylglycine-generating enzyme required for sulfatase activity
VAPEDSEATGGLSGASSGEHEESGGLGLSGKLLAGRYRVQSRLGQGGMAAVYQAQDERLNRTVVVKVPHAALLVDPGFRKRFAAEVNNLAKLEHPNIIPIHDVGEDDGVPFAVVQFLRGGDLGDRVREAGGRITPEKVIEWLPRIADTLDYVHARGFLHRDVSPGNIIFDDHGNAHLSDFGIATAVSADDPDETTREFSNLTKPGGFVGAATYAPPESIERKLNPSYDQYSLGVVIYEALCGQVPFPRGSSEAMLVSKNTKEPIPLDQQVAGLPPAVVAAVMRAISKDPADRFESSKAFTQAFQQALQTSPAATVSPAPVADPGTVIVDVSMHEKKTGMRWGAIVGGVVVLALAGAAAVYQPWKGFSGAGRPGTDVVADTPVATTGSSPAEFTMGSSAAEQQAAFELCGQALGSDCNREDYADEEQRTVTIAPIEIDRHEVTNREFAAFVSETRYETTAEEVGHSFTPLTKGTNLSWRAPTRSTGYRDRPDHPVVHVSAADAAAYCESRGKRLPSEAEWEYGARGQDRSRFPWGDDWSDGKATWNASGPSAVGATPAGASWSGAQDMAGNVWEWTRTEAEGGVILKGGSWFDNNPALLRGATKMIDEPQRSSADIGFRCVKDL